MCAPGPAGKRDRRDRTGDGQLGPIVEDRSMRMRSEEKIRTLATAWLHRMRQRSRPGGARGAVGRARIPSWLPVFLCLVILGVAVTATRSRGAGGGGA